MAIHSHEENGFVYFRIRVTARSQVDREIRYQKESKGSFPVRDPEQTRKHLQRIESQLFVDARMEVAKREGAGVVWGDLVTRWENEAREGKEDSWVHEIGSRTAHGYLQAARDHTDSWLQRPSAEITCADFENLVKAMKRVGYANSTIYNVKSAVNHCFKWGLKRRLIRGVTLSPTFGVRISRANSKRPEILNYTDICKLLDHAQSKGHAWFPIWKVLLHTGFRSGEAHELKRKDLDRDNKMIYLERKYNFQFKTIEGLKDKDWRQVPINDELMTFLTERGAWELSPEAHVLPRIAAWAHCDAAKVLREFCDEIKIPSVCLHTLRACWATQLLRNKTSLVQVMAMGGWSDLETMQRYLRLAGIELEGATDSLQFQKRERPGRLLKLVGREG